MSVKISVIVPVYNVEQYIEECLESLHAQSYPNLEIIVVDDGSTDGSGKKCDVYKNIDQRFTIIHKENGGLVSARKAGAKVAKGEYISNVDGDDWVKAGCYKTLATYLENDPDIVSFGYQEYYENNKTTKVKPYSLEEGFYKDTQFNNIKEKLFSTDQFFESAIEPNLCTKLIKRELFLCYENKVSDLITYGEDAACVYPCIWNSKSIEVVHYSPYFYRRRVGSITKKNEELSEEKVLALYNSLLDSPKNTTWWYEQFHLYMFFVLLAKKYSAIKSTQILFPYSAVKKGDKIAIYGAGIFGMIMKKEIENSSFLTLTCIVDQQYKQISSNTIKVDPIERLKDNDFDYVLIAILDAKVSKEVKCNLLELSIDVDKILTIDSQTILKQPLDLKGIGAL